VIRRWIMAVGLALSVVLPFVPDVKPAEAVAFWPKWTGYFHGQVDNEGDSVLAGGIHPVGPDYATSFITTIKNYSNGPIGQNRTGAEFIIDTMLGDNSPGDPADAHVREPLWEQAVRYYDSQGWVNWNDTQSSAFNSYWQGNNGGGPEPNDDAWYDQNVSGDAITFHKPGGGFYILRKECANPLGTLDGLALPDFNLDGDLVPSPGTPAFETAPGTGIIEPGLYSLTPSVRNTKANPSEAFAMEVAFSCCAYAPESRTYMQMQAIGSVPPATGFSRRPPDPGPCAVGFVNCWHWDYGNGVGGGVTSVINNGAIFNIPAAAPEGAHLCVYLVISPKDQTGATLVKGPFCYNVHHPRYPGVVGNNSDIHAGGGVCGQALQPASQGFIAGLPAAGSKGEYVVSASAVNGINGLKSNGTGADSLRVGQNGDYAQSCRPDLVKVGNAYITAGGGHSTIAGSVSVTNMSGVYWVNGGDIHLTGGIISHRVTIFHAGGGNVYIDGNIQIDGANHALNPNDPDNSIPSLGIISSNGILISNAVTRVDAYMFADGAIDTCTPQGVLGNACNSTLVVNGFVMSQSLALHRLGPAGSNGQQVGERINMTPQIYINPPKLFDASVDDILLQGQGERQPLF
jgi:hypothetical protein